MVSLWSALCSYNTVMLNIVVTLFQLKKRVVNLKQDFLPLCKGCSCPVQPFCCILCLTFVRKGTNTGPNTPDILPPQKRAFHHGLFVSFAKMLMLCNQDSVSVAGLCHSRSKYLNEKGSSQKLQWQGVLSPRRDQGFSLYSDSSKV